MPKQTFYYGTRRDFLKSTSLLAGAAVVSAPYFLRGQGSNERINVACIGVGGKGDSDSYTLNKKNGQLKDRAGKESRTYDAKLYRDWRKMFEEMGKSIDAVTVS